MCCVETKMYVNIKAIKWYEQHPYQWMSHLSSSDQWHCITRLPTRVPVSASMWMVHMGLTPPPPPAQCLHSESEQVPWGWCMLLYVCTLFSPLTFYAMKEATVHPACLVHLVFRKEMHWGGYGVWQGRLGNTAGTYFTKYLNNIWKWQLTHIRNRLRIWLCKY